MKIGLYIALVVVILGGLKWAHSAVYDSGYNAAVVEQNELIRQAKDEAVKKARDEWEKTAVIAEDNIVVEERIVEVERVIEKEIPRIVEKIVTVTPECNDLGSEFASLLNAQVNSGAGGENSGPDLTTEPNP